MYLDVNGAVLCEGDTITLTIHGLGEGTATIIEKEGALYIHDPNQDDLLVVEALMRNDIIIEKWV